MPKQEFAYATHTFLVRHNDPIQCLAFNPSQELLLSCSANDFGLWTQEKKNVNKIKVPAKINVCAWGSEGDFLALGLGNGIVSIRNRVILIQIWHNSV